MSTYDLLIRGGTIVDGNGSPSFLGDVGIKGGKIVAVGQLDGKAAETLDADGLLVTPGFVDIHTHYDGQATWSERLSPSSWHGVTTVVAGNCGVGFAPCRPEDRDTLIRVMEGVEDIPGIVLKEGVQWDWESFPEFMDALGRRRYDMDIAVQVPHGPVRVHAMGDRAVAREPATANDIRKMQELVAEALAAGALGFSTSRTLIHRLRDGSLAPTVTAGEEELRGIVQAIKRVGKGVLQMVCDYNGVDTEDVSELAMWRRLVEESGRPLSFNFVQAHYAPERWRVLLRFLEAANAAGLTMKGQVCNRPIGMLFGLQCSFNPFSGCPGFDVIAGRPLKEIVAAMRDPALRERLLKETPRISAKGLLEWLRAFSGMYRLGNPPDYLPKAGTDIAALAAQQGRSALEYVYDYLMEDEGRALLYFPAANYAQRDSQAIETMLWHPHTVPGIGDGGAHVGMICDVSLTTHLLTHWTRDRRDGRRVPVEQAVKWLTRDSAETVGLRDRGLLARGYKADLNLIDYEHLAIGLPEACSDLPAGGSRLVQRARGYVANVVNGQITYRNGEATDALPGRLIRGQQNAQPL